MKRVLFFTYLVVIGTLLQVNAQSLHSQKDPYEVILERVNNPDTFFLCKNYTRNFNKRTGLQEVSIILYKEESSWFAIEVTRKRRLGREVLSVSVPCYVLTGGSFEDNWTKAKLELQNYFEYDDASLIHSSIYIKENEYEVKLWILGNVRDWFHNIPMTAYFYTLGLFSVQGQGGKIDYKLKLSELK